MLPIDEHDPLANVPGCKNCGTPHWDGERYCADCGQKIFTGPPTVWKLMTDFFENFFNVDNRIFRTLRDLAIPGKLTTHYLAGRQQPYLNPLRLFFISAVLMLGSAAIFTTASVKESFNKLAMESRLNGYRTVFKEEIQTAIDSIQRSFPGEEALLATDSLQHLLNFDTEDSTTLVHFIYAGSGVFEPVQTELTTKDLYTLSPEKITDNCKIEGWWSRFQFQQLIRIKTMDSQGITLLFSQLVWGLLLIIPLCALMLKLFYIRSKRLFIEHTIFSLHVHTCLFLLLTLAFLLIHFYGIPHGLILAGVAITVYFPLALRRVYQQSWGKTLLKMLLLFLGYVFIVSICAIVSVVISVALF